MTGTYPQNIEENIAKVLEDRAEFTLEEAWRGLRWYSYGKVSAVLLKWWRKGILERWDRDNERWVTAEKYMEKYSIPKTWHIARYRWTPHT